MTKPTSPPAEFKLGERVVISQMLHREHSGPWNGEERLWKPVVVAPSEGVVVGKRTLRDGKRIWLGEDEGSGFAPNGTTHEAYMIAFDIRHNPIPALAEHILTTKQHIEKNGAI